MRSASFLREAALRFHRSGSSLSLSSKNPAGKFSLLRQQKSTVSRHPSLQKRRIVLSNSSRSLARTPPARQCASLETRQVIPRDLSSGLKPRSKTFLWHSSLLRRPADPSPPKCGVQIRNELGISQGAVIVMKGHRSGGTCHPRVLRSGDYQML
jgi:hypothetical protein